MTNKKVIHKDENDKRTLKKKVDQGRVTGTKVFFSPPLHNPPTSRSQNVFNSATASSASSSQNQSSPRLSQIRPLMGMEPGTVSPFLATRTYLKKGGHEQRKDGGKDRQPSVQLFLQTETGVFEI